jgi:hypothetical protein
MGHHHHHLPFGEVLTVQTGHRSIVSASSAVGSSLLGHGPTIRDPSFRDSRHSVGVEPSAHACATNVTLTSNRRQRRFIGRS